MKYIDNSDRQQWAELFWGLTQLQHSTCELMYMMENKTSFPESYLAGLAFQMKQLEHEISQIEATKEVADDIPDTFLFEEETE